MVEIVISALIPLTALWAYWDATGHKIGKLPGVGGMFNMSAGAWAAATLGLWIVGFPAYVIKRSALIEQARNHPVEVNARIAKAGLLAVIGVMWPLLTVVGAMAPPVQ